jgi:hypothetical protein
MSDLIVSKFPKNEKMLVCAYWKNGDMTVSLCPNSKQDLLDLLDNIEPIDGIEGLTVKQMKDMMFHGEYVDSSSEPDFKFGELFAVDQGKTLAKIDWVSEEDDQA